MLPDYNDDVDKIIKIIEKHCLNIDNRNYKDLNLYDEYKYYNKNFIKALDNYNYKKSVEEMSKNNDLILNLKNIVWYRNYFNEEITKCKVTVESEF